MNEWKAERTCICGYLSMLFKILVSCLFVFCCLFVCFCMPYYPLPRTKSNSIELISQKLSCISMFTRSRISRWNYKSFVMVIKLNNRCTQYATKMNFWLPTVQIQKLILWRYFENGTFPLTSMASSHKRYKENLEQCLILCSSIHETNLIKANRLLTYSFNPQMIPNDTKWTFP